MNVTECLLKITELTKQNVDILTAINEAFFAKNTAVQTSVAGTRYIIPSFINLENKINHLQDAYDNLVHAAQSGEAWLNYDGNTKDIILQGYQQAPNPLHLGSVSTFGKESVDLFKDMLSPRPFINFVCSELPDNVYEVNVKKIVVYNDDLLSGIQQITGTDEASYEIDYAAAADLLKGYTEDEDYGEYDTVYSLNPRKTTGYGVYEVVEVSGDRIRDTFTKDEKTGDLDLNNSDVDLEEIITVTINSGDYVVEHEYNGNIYENWPAYVQSDGYTKAALEDGFVLCSYDGSAQFEIVESLSENVTITTDDDGNFRLQLRVLHGAYVDIQPGNGDYGMLKFYSTSTSTINNLDKSLHIPLEEDRYICLFLAPLNSRVRVQSVWGAGLFIDTYKLYSINSDGTVTNFEDYYDDNVSNIGDTLTELTTIMSPSITKYSQDEFQVMTETQPEFATGDDTNTGFTSLGVTQINKHLDDSETVQTIRSLYAQKQQLNTELSEVQQRITSLNSELSQISFDDLSGTRSMYENQLTDLKSRQNELSSGISKVVDLIAQAANNSVIPIENAKFRVRGYVDVESFIKTVNDKAEKNIIGLGDVVGVQIRYRYKNYESPQANVSVVNDYLFTEWTLQEPKVRKRKMSYVNGSYDLQWTDTILNTTGEEIIDTTRNEPKFNQVDVPITQGESVDIQARILYIFGYPFVEVTSEWSDIISVEFPEELIQDVTVIGIIEENNNDIETLRFQNILDNAGVTAHVDDNIVDQDLTYFHKPENIASGFYTDERRIIPLRDKLTEMNNSLTEIEDLIKGTTSEALEVSVTLDNQTYVLEPDVENNIQLTPYSGVAVGKIASGTAYREKTYGPVQMTGSIKITNKTDHTVYLYSVFPAARTTNVPDIRPTRRKFDLDDYYNFGADRVVVEVK